MKKLAHSFWKLMVPHYAAVVIIGFCASSLILARDLNALTRVYYSLPLVLSAFGLNAYNQVLDYEIDKRSKPKRPLPAGEFREKQVIAVSAALFAAAIATAFFLGVLPHAIAFIALSIAYSTPFFKIRVLPLASNIVGGTLYGALPFLAASTVFNAFDGFFFALFYATAIIAATAKDFEDAEHDEKFGVKTLPVMVGKKHALAFIPLSLTFVLLVALVLLFLSGAGVKLLYACNFSLALVLLFLYVVEKASKRAITAVTQSWFATATVALVLIVQLAFGLARVV